MVGTKYQWAPWMSWINIVLEWSAKTQTELKALTQDTNTPNRMSWEYSAAATELLWWRRQEREERFYYFDSNGLYRLPWCKKIRHTASSVKTLNVSSVNTSYCCVNTKYNIDEQKQQQEHMLVSNKLANAASRTSEITEWHHKTIIVLVYHSQQHG